MKKSLLTLAMIAATCGLAGAQTLIEAASYDFSDYPEGPFAGLQALGQKDNPSWPVLESTYPEKELFMIGGRMADSADMPEKFASGVNVVDLGNNVGKVLAVSFMNSHFNDWVKTNFGLTENVVTNMPIFPGWVDLFFMLRGLPESTHIRTEIICNVFDNAMNGGKPAGTYANQVFVRNFNGGFYPKDEVQQKYPLTLAPFSSDVALKNGWYYDSSAWVKISFDDMTQSFPENSIDNVQYFPYHLTIKLTNTYTKSSTLFIKAINVYAIDGGSESPVRTIEPVHYTMTFNGITGVESVEVNNEEAPAEYFNLQGVRVENPTNGIYVKKQGNKMSKVMVK